MARRPHLSGDAASAAADAVLALLDGGFLRIYDGKKPANPDTPVGDQPLLAQLAFGSPAFSASSDGVATATAITGEQDAVAGTAKWFRTVATDETVVFDGWVGTSNADLVLDAVEVQRHAPVDVTALTYSQAKT